MSDESLVTAAEIARLANVGRAAVSNWRRRYQDFPEPALQAGGTVAFKLQEVVTWLRKQGKVSDVAPAESIWRALDSDADTISAVAEIVSHLRGIGSVPLPANVREALDRLGDVPAGDLIESLCARAFERQQRQHLVTPDELARLMVDLAGSAGGNVFDPACGPGNILRAAAEAGATSVAGQELEEALATIARARLEGRVPTEIAAGDALRSDAFPHFRADTVVCDPPFGYRDWGHEVLAIDSRWEYGFPAKGEPELAWVQHCLAHVKPGGTVVVALPASVSQRRSGRAVRQALLRRGAIRAVIALPAGVLMSTGIPLHLWVLRNPDDAGPGPVLLLSTGHHQPSRRGQVDWHALGLEIRDVWQEFCELNTVTESPGRCRTVEPIDLLDDEVDLTPSRHLPQPAVNLDLKALDSARQELFRVLDEVRGELPLVREGVRRKRVATSIGDLARAGALSLFQQSGPLDTAAGGSGPFVLSGRDVSTGVEPSTRYVGGGGDEPVHLRPGDLVVPLLAAGEGRPKTRVIDTEGLVLGPNLQLIRVDETRLDVHFLAGQIRAADPARVGSTTASGVYRFDIRRFEVPVLELTLQRRLGVAFARLATFQDRLTVAAARGADLAQRLTFGLADGAIELEE